MKGTDYSRDSNKTRLPPEAASEQVMRERIARRVKRFRRYQKRAMFHQQPVAQTTWFGRLKARIRRWFKR